MSSSTAFLFEADSGIAAASFDGWLTSSAASSCADKAGSLEAFAEGREPRAKRLPNIRVTHLQNGVHDHVTLLTPHRHRPQPEGELAAGKSPTVTPGAAVATKTGRGPCPKYCDRQQLSPASRRRPPGQLPPRVAPRPYNSHTSTQLGQERLVGAVQTLPKAAPRDRLSFTVVTTSRYFSGGVICGSSPCVRRGYLWKFAFCSPK